ncbi:hypothetical protein FA95DRAFT_1676310 [Auriscalpium vulgare]|uniref:Uncharacterized protein n=1 Tax=Auriscalpium vulgare TaxID=40419 RepID=A0ACB8S4C5_9AGAM|nr:hypothetical protein FA95DRAFT_1676310 [Auriscalpium vulgare]
MTTEPTTEPPAAERLRGTKRSFVAEDSVASLLDPSDGEDFVEQAYKRQRYDYVRPTPAPEAIMDDPWEWDPDYKFVPDNALPIFTESRAISSSHKRGLRWNMRDIFYTDTPKAESARAKKRRLKRKAAEGGKRHVKWWFADGDVVIRAEGKMFKVHRKVLEDHLRGMREMLEDATEQSKDAEKVDGAMVFDDDDESASNWELMCLLLYHPRRWNVKLYIQWDDVRALLALSRRYCCLRFRDAAVHALSTFCPTKLENFDHRLTNACIIGKQPSTFAAAVNLILEYDIPELLPSALFAVAERSYMEMLFGVPGDPERRPQEILDDAILLRIASGRERLLQMRRDVIFASLRTVSHPTHDGYVALKMSYGCTGAEIRHAYTCQQWYLRLARDWDEHRDEMFEEGGVTRALQALHPSAWKKMRKHLCPSCWERFVRDMRRGRREVWRRLPMLFGLGDWYELARKASEVRERDFAWYLQEEAKRVRNGEVEVDWAKRENWPDAVFHSRIGGKDQYQLVWPDEDSEIKV